MKKVGVIGTGNFGLALSNLLAINNEVLIYGRREEVVKEINENGKLKGQNLNERITAIHDFESLAKECKLIFPIVPSSNFKEMLVQLSPFLTPEHILIHGTKGLHIDANIDEVEKLDKSEVLTMSELILNETSVVRVGCIAGPNLAKEISDGQIGGTVIASRYNDVIREGKKAVNSNVMRVYGSNETKGVEIASVLKNYIAIAAGMLEGIGYGDNAKALLITRGMAEMVFFGKAFGAGEKAFMGLAGIGDLMATCNSKLSRNFRVGYYLAQGKKLPEILEELNEVAEGIKTVKIVKLLENYKFNSPLADALYKILYEDWDLKQGMEFLMNLPVSDDTDFFTDK
ncbi:MAG: NAD(P)H-dependent glycerol-3-phosphate dehydrogenase [Flavobacteriales bacterium]